MATVVYRPRDKGISSLSPGGSGKDLSLTFGNLKKLTVPGVQKASVHTPHHVRPGVEGVSTPAEQPEVLSGTLLSGCDDDLLHRDSKTRPQKPEGVP